MSALTDKLARLRADLAAATPGPLKVHDNFAWIACDSNGTEIVDFNGDSLTVAEDNANARAHVGAVNAAPTLLDIAEAAAKYLDEMRKRIAADDVESFERAHHASLDARAALFSALDRAEAEAAR